MTKKRFSCIGLLCAFAVLLVFSLSLFSCSLKESVKVEAKKLDFSAFTKEELLKYVTLGEYKNLKVKQGDMTQGEAVWQAVIENCNVKKYPEEHLYYYIDNIEGQYKYYAEEAGISYNDLLSELGINEGSILKEAKALTLSDMVFALIVKTEGIELGNEEKTELFEKYSEKYVKDYGYDAEYVRKNLSEQIYESMLYDKTTEFLIINNEIE